MLYAVTKMFARLSLNVFKNQHPIVHTAGRIAKLL